MIQDFEPLNSVVRSRQFFQGTQIVKDYIASFFFPDTKAVKDYFQQIFNYPWFYFGG